MPSSRTRVAVACQGGGSHTAFTAGVLKRLLTSTQHEFVAFSGTSGGAIDALLAWYGLLQDGPEGAGDRLEAFWEDIAATSWPELWGNAISLAVHRVLAPVVAPEVSPYLYQPWGSERLRSTLEHHVDFSRLPDLVTPSAPWLLVGAVDVLSGRFEVFKNGWDPDGDVATASVTADAILASAAIPTLFRAVHIGEGVYWDGLFSQNPPVRDLPHAGPDEIWVVQINPTERRSEPMAMADIRDRRNELAGNLSLRQELDFICKINELVKGDGGNKLEPGSKYRLIDIRILELDAGTDLDTESKLDRNPAFIKRLFRHGEAQAEAFLGDLPN